MIEVFVKFMIHLFQQHYSALEILSLFLQVYDLQTVHPHSLQNQNIGLNHLGGFYIYQSVPGSLIYSE